MKIFQVFQNLCYKEMPFSSLAEVAGRFPPDVLFVEAPDYVNEHWGYDDTKQGDECFIKPTPPDGFIIDDDGSGAFIPEDELPRLLAETQANKQEENKALLADWLNKNPVTFVDGKEYGISKEDQEEISLNLTQYMLQVQAGVENPILEWHAIKEACVPWTQENLTALTLTISAAVYPAMSLMQQYKEQIYKCETREEVRNIELDYNPLNKIEGEVENVDAE